MGAAEREDSVGAFHRPEHAGLFEAGADHGFAASLDNEGADEEMLSAELGVAHALYVVAEVVGLGANLFSQGRVSGTRRAQRENQFFDLPFVEPALLVDLHRGFLLAGVVGKQQTGDGPQVLAGVIQIDEPLLSAAPCEAPPLFQIGEGSGQGVPPVRTSAYVRIIAIQKKENSKTLPLKSHTLAGVATSHSRRFMLAAVANDFAQLYDEGGRVVQVLKTI